jgi:hypothetical protein
MGYFVSTANASLRRVLPGGVTLSSWIFEGPIVKCDLHIVCFCNYIAYHSCFIKKARNLFPDFYFKKKSKTKNATRCYRVFVHDTWSAVTEKDHRVFPNLMLRNTAAPETHWTAPHPILIHIWRVSKRMFLKWCSGSDQYGISVTSKYVRRSNGLSTVTSRLWRCRFFAVCFKVHPHCELGRLRVLFLRNVGSSY